MQAKETKVTAFYHGDLTIAAKRMAIKVGGRKKTKECLEC